MTQEADNLDNATALSQQLTEAYIHEARARGKPEQVQDDKGNWPTLDCVECGEEIVSARLAMARIRCVHCQALRERSQRFTR